MKMGIVKKLYLKKKSNNSKCKIFLEKNMDKA